MRNGSGKGPIRLIGALLGIVGLTAAVAVALNVVNVAHRVDASAIEREAAALRQGIYLLGELTAAEQLSLTQWDEALDKVVFRPQQRFIRDYFGRAVFSEPDEQRVYILDADGEIVFASHRNGVPRRAEARQVQEAAANVVRRVRRVYERQVSRGDTVEQRFGEHLLEGIYEHDVTRIDGDPALVIASPFIGDVAGKELPDSPTMMVELRPFTPALLARLEQLAHLEGIGVVGDDLPPGLASHAIVDRNGAETLRLAWNHSAPGSTVLVSTLPALTLSTIVVALLSLGAAVMLRRRTAQLADSERAAVYASRHDAATGLANRGWFLSELERRLSDTTLAGCQGVVLIDCDYFKAVNDTLGHAAGDAVLAAIADRLRSLGDRISIAARLGGDEFAVVTGPRSSVDELEWSVSEIADTLMRPVRYGVHTIPVSVSMGAVMAAAGGDMDDLLSQADLALYRAKRDGRGCFRIYDPKVDMVEEKPVDAADLSVDRRKAIGGREAA